MGAAVSRNILLEKKKVGLVSFTPSASEHIKSFAFPHGVVMVAFASAVAVAANLPDAAGEDFNDLLGAIYSHLLAGTDGGDPRGFVAASASGCLAAALEGIRAGTQVSGAAGAGTVADPAAVAGGSVVASGLAAALHVYCVPLTATVDECATG